MPAWWVQVVILTHYYRVVFPQWLIHQDINIVYLEILAVLLGLKLWVTQVQCNRIVIKCDRLTVVNIINSGRSQDKFLQQALSELCFLCTCINIEIQAVHILGVQENQKLKCKRSWVQEEMFTFVN